MIREYFEIKNGHILHHFLADRPADEANKLQRRLLGLFAYNKNFHRTEVGAYQQVIRGLQKEIEEIKFELAATQENSKRHLDAWNKTVEEKKELEFTIEKMKTDMEFKRKLQMEMVRLCRKRRLKIEGMEKEISGLKDTVQLWRGIAEDWKDMSKKWEGDYDNLNGKWISKWNKRAQESATVKDKLQKEIDSLEHDKTVLIENTAEHIVEIVDLKKENKDKDAYYVGLLKNKDEQIIDLKIRLSIASAGQGFTDYLYKLASKKTTKTENV